MATRSTGCRNGRASFDFFRFLRVNGRASVGLVPTKGFRTSRTSRAGCALGWVSREGGQSYRSALGLEREQEAMFYS
jgi:hypothetical protein